MRPHTTRTTPSLSEDYCTFDFRHEESSLPIYSHKFYYRTFCLTYNICGSRCEPYNIHKLHTSTTTFCFSSFFRPYPTCLPVYQPIHPSNRKRKLQMSLDTLSVLKFLCLPSYVSTPTRSRSQECPHLPVVG